MQWIGEARSQSQVTEREFRVECEGRAIPGVLWTGEEPAR